MIATSYVLNGRVHAMLMVLLPLASVHPLRYSRQWLMPYSGLCCMRVPHSLIIISITMGLPGSEECGCNFDRILAICRGLGVPLAEEKLKGTSNILWH